MARRDEHYDSVPIGATEGIYRYREFAGTMKSLQTGDPLVERLRGTDCQYGECAGTLRRATFKSDEAVVCENCGTPAVRLW